MLFYGDAMKSAVLTPELTMLRAGRFQFYLWDDGKTRVLIDTGPEGSRSGVADRVEGLDLVVLTHCHYDHCGSAAELRRWSGAEVVAGAADAPIIQGIRDAAPSRASVMRHRRYCWIGNSRCGMSCPPMCPGYPLR